MTLKLTSEENTIIDYVESNNAPSINNLENEKDRYKQIAIAQMSKKKAINIRLLECELRAKWKPVHSLV